MTGTMKDKPAACCCDCKIDGFTTAVGMDGDTIRSAVHPQSPYATWLQAEIYATGPEALSLFLVWDEGTPGDGLYVEFTPEDAGPPVVAGTLKLFRKDDVQIGTTLDLLCAVQHQWHRITICYDPDTAEFTACFDAADDRGYIVQGQCVTGTVPAGFVPGTKAGYSGTNATIRNYRYERLWYCGDPPYTSDCHVLGDIWDVYNDLPPRLWCHKCGSPSCTIVDEDFSDIVGDINTPGAMPCGWDADVTDWGVVDGAATGNGAVMHLVPLSGVGYVVTATFSTGTLATDGDSITFSLIGSATLSATLTRVAWNTYSVTYNVAGMTGGTSATQPTEIMLKACPSTLYGTEGIVAARAFQAIIDTSMGVSITQPTEAGHADGSLIAFTITKHKSVDEDCPDCDIICSDCEFPDYLFLDIGPAFLTKQYDCGVCADVSGVIALVATSSCGWRYSGGSCACDDPDCNPPATERRLYWSVQAYFTHGVIPALNYWTVIITIFPFPIMDPGSPRACGIQTDAGLTFQLFNANCTDSPVTIPNTVAAGTNPLTPLLAGAECYGASPRSVRIAFDPADL